jgi:hypothetical protein
VFSLCCFCRLCGSFVNAGLGFHMFVVLCMIPWGFAFFSVSLLLFFLEFFDEIEVPNSVVVFCCVLQVLYLPFTRLV